MVETLLAFNYRDIVKAIFKKFDPATTRQLLKIRNKRNSTPMREAVRRLPG